MKLLLGRFDFMRMFGYTFISTLTKADMSDEKKTGERKWSDSSILKPLPNPSSEGYEISMTVDRLTFLGTYNQPDFAVLKIKFYPKEFVIELKALKLYIQQFRNKVISYERLANVIYEDLKTVYDPVRVRLEMETTPRGDIGSKITIDSDWKVRGGLEKFKDWVRPD